VHCELPEGHDGNHRRSFVFEPNSYHDPTVYPQQEYVVTWKDDPA
jgi:hypothetical protein